MISLIEGQVVAKNKQSIVVLTTGGVGYEIFVSANFWQKIILEQKLSLLTYLKVSDSALDLYGFANLEERAFFSQLLTVSGVGPKTALNILSLGTLTNIQSAIARGDVSYLTAVQGMGKKTAERLVVELKTKLATSQSDNLILNSDTLGDAVAGLMAMGYSQDEAKTAITGIATEGKEVADIIRLALRAK